MSEEGYIPAVQDHIEIIVDHLPGGHTNYTIKAYRAVARTAEGQVLLPQPYVVDISNDPMIIAQVLSLYVALLNRDLVTMRERSGQEQAVLSHG